MMVRRTGELAEMKKQLEKHALDVEVLCLAVPEKGDEIRMTLHSES